MPQEQNVLLTINDVAERLQCSTRTVRRLISAGALQSVRVGPAERLVRVSERELAVYLTRQNA